MPEDPQYRQQRGHFRRSADAAHFPLKALRRCDRRTDRPLWCDRRSLHCHAARAERPDPILFTGSRRQGNLYQRLRAARAVPPGLLSRRRDALQCSPGRCAVRPCAGAVHRQHQKGRAGSLLPAFGRGKLSSFHADVSCPPSDSAAYRAAASGGGSALPGGFHLSDRSGRGCRFPGSIPGNGRSGLHITGGGPLQPQRKEPRR